MKTGVFNWIRMSNISEHNHMAQVFNDRHQGERGHSQEGQFIEAGQLEFTSQFDREDEKFTKGGIERFEVDKAHERGDDISSDDGHEDRDDL